MAGNIQETVLKSSAYIKKKNCPTDGEKDLFFKGIQVLKEADGCTVGFLEALRWQLPLKSLCIRQLGISENSHYLHL